MITEEENYIVEISDSEVRCHRPDGTLDSLSWKNLQRVEVVVDASEALPVTFFALHGQGAALVIPEGATNSDELGERLFELPDFDADLFVDSMSSVESKTFVCWKKED
ncbi:MAG: hypothetical protein ACI8XO_004400 [Verrucomicrobiales bacterium]|jgi:hypothetical protein